MAGIGGDGDDGAHLAVDLDSEEQALADSKVQAAMKGMKVVKAIVIKKKIVNFVVKPE